MDSNFSKYNWEAFLEEKSFISWVTKNENDIAWENFLSRHPEVKREVGKARELINILQDKYDKADEKTVERLWRSIDQFNQQYDKKTVRTGFRKTLSWAASFLLILMVGSLALLYMQAGKSGYEFSEFSSNEAVVVLSTGERILLEKSRSKIEIHEEKEHLTVNDSNIRLDGAMQQNDRLNELLMPFGNKSELVLSDGTVVWLNAGSKLAFPIEFSDSRMVYLEGEACFQVTKGNHPFIVKTEGLDITVLGTLFNVSAYKEQETIETVLINGSVSLNTTNKIFNNSEILSPHQKGSFSKKGDEITISDEPDAENYISWVRDWLEYRRESLNSVLQKLERYYDVKFHLPSNFPADDKISGKLDLKESLDNVMKILSDAAGIEYQVKGKEIFVRQKRES